MGKGLWILRALSTAPALPLGFIAFRMGLLGMGILRCLIFFSVGGFGITFGIIWKLLDYIVWFDMSDDTVVIPGVFCFWN